ncbi:hypothetical protein K432DRAFT_429103 [Lepidopterella palustris CBS 459.81]|uniref:Uncharacterized protein n=1 Tax=Lepidopterella palustris CBS 459.81 TaxID=1314670 RepID=A0A8E2JAY1_9PEZI|nr:hypothetical protein K432DRAFT_429103 [Lepidopterella palustris CBS 459.81]
MFSQFRSPPYSHAHPLRNSPGLGYIQDSDAHVPKLAVQLDLRGLTAPERVTPLSVFCPQVRRSESSSLLQIEPLDVISTWKDLSIAQAHEIAFWEKCFKESLETLVSSALMESFGEQQSCYKDSNNGDTLIARVINFIKAIGSKTFHIDIHHLINAMIEIYYEAQQNQQHRWFVSTRNLPVAICNFLRTRDCFKHTFLHAEVNIKFSAKMVFEPYGVQIVGDVDWNPPRVDFTDFTTVSTPGSEYRLLPQYQDHILDDQHVSYAVDPVYHVASETLPLAWDQSTQGFRCIVPNITARAATSSRSLLNDFRDHYSSQSDIVHMAEFSFTTAVTRFFPNSVRFEQVARFKIRLRVTPKPPVHSFVPNFYFDSAYLEKGLDGDGLRKDFESKLDQFAYPDRKDCLFDLPVDELQVNSLFAVETDTPIPDCLESGARVSSWLPSYTNTPVSACRRTSNPPLPKTARQSPPSLPARILSYSTLPTQSRLGSISPRENSTDDLESVANRLVHEEGRVHATLRRPFPSIDQIGENESCSDGLNMPTSSRRESTTSAKSDLPIEMPIRNRQSRRKSSDGAEGYISCGRSDPAWSFQEDERRSTVPERMAYSDDDTEWNEEFAPFMLSVTTDNSGEARGTPRVPSKRCYMRLAAEPSEQTDDSRYTNTEDGYIDDGTEFVSAYARAPAEGKISPNSFRKVRKSFLQSISTDFSPSKRQRRCDDPVLAEQRPSNGLANAYSSLYSFITSLGDPIDSIFQANLSPVDSAHQSETEMDIPPPSCPGRLDHDLANPQWTWTRPLDLSQQEIQANYEAFLREKENQKLAVSTVQNDDDEAKAFEAAFLESDEEWDDGTGCDEDETTDYEDDEEK